MADPQDDAGFREELRAWLAGAVADLPPAPARDDWDARRAFDTAWQRRLFDAGYAGLGMPEEYGGRPVPLTQSLIFLEECARAGAPAYGCNLVGVTHAAPTLLSEGTDEQRQRLVPSVLRGDEIWCQGFSETEAGSDLANLRCAAVRDGDDYVINGHKLWTTHAQVADWCELLVRTDPDAPKHRGITYLCLPMDLPGITVRPIRTLAGEREFAEVTFEDVRCPVENRVGPENDGWRVAMVTFSHERTTTFVYDLVRALRKAEALADLARRTATPGGTLWDSDAFRRDLGRITAGLEAMWALTREGVDAVAAGRDPGVGAVVGKAFVTDHLQQLDELGVSMLGEHALTLDGDGDAATRSLVHDRLLHASFTIAGGTTQIQRNIVAERVLGLPKEPAWTR